MVGCRRISEEVLNGLMLQKFGSLKVGCRRISEALVNDLMLQKL